MKLQNKTAVVTGSSRGIGRAIALRLGQDGATVVVNYKGNEQAAQSAVEEIERSGGKAQAMQADIADLLDVRRLFAEIESSLGRLDILVNNAGWADFKVLDEVDEDSFDATFDLNVRGLFFATQEAARIMNDGGRIVNISSGITRVNSGVGSVYAGSKAAVEAFTRCWSDDLGKRSITVNTVSPGGVETDLLIDAMGPEAVARMAAQSPFNRIGQPADIADVVAFLCSEDARWLTAQNILANGGVG
jgi:3-oxoacyl-[acyl-carrier protein] reductase